MFAMFKGDGQPSGGASGFGNHACLAQRFLGTHPVGLVGPGGEHIPGGRGAQVIVFDVLERGFVRSGPGRIRLGSVE